MALVPEAARDRNLAPRRKEAGKAGGQRHKDGDGNVRRSAGDLEAIVRGLDIEARMRSSAAAPFAGSSGRLRTKSVRSQIREVVLAPKTERYPRPSG